jgi:hypothetical protein
MKQQHITASQHDSTTFVEVSLKSLVWCMKMQSPTRKFSSPLSYLQGATSVGV